MDQFELVSEFEPTGDQPKTIDALVQSIDMGNRHQTLLGATGTGKTFVMANIIAQLNKPTLILAHNKTLAAQLYSEFRDFFPHNAVEYFVSYYDYYQPEAYVPRHDLYIEKETQINDQIDRLRIAATASLLSRSDVLIVASVSCIYGLGSPLTWERTKVVLSRGEHIRRDTLLRKLVQIQYDRNDLELRHGVFRVRGDTLEVMPSYGSHAIRIEMWGDDIERITEFDPLTGEIITDKDEVTIFPSRHYIAEQNTIEISLQDIEDELEERVAYLERENKLLEAQRLKQRTLYDLDMLRETGFCSGIENYSRHMDRRQPGEPPFTLLDFFPDEWLLIVDESHMTLPQVRGMYGGDRSRKEMLVDYGFRLPSALDNRPLNFEEFEKRVPQALYTSATPGPYEMEHSAVVVEQIIRPTGLVDPKVEVRPVEGQIDDLLEEIRLRIERGERTLVTTLTIRMSEKLTEFMVDAGLKVAYLHSQIDTIERVEILRDLRLGAYDVVVGINLLREGLDLPEVSLVAILDADKQGFLRSETALIQTIGRAARHVNGQVIMYADKVSDAMQAAIDETNRRREIQMTHNKQHGIEPQSIRKAVRDLTERVRTEALQAAGIDMDAEDIVNPGKMPTHELEHIIAELEEQMKEAAAALEFEKAALLRDQVYEMRDVLISKQTGRSDVPIWEQDRMMPIADEEG